MHWFEYRTQRYPPCVRIIVHAPSKQAAADRISAEGWQPEKPLHYQGAVAKHKLAAAKDDPAVFLIPQR